MSFKKTLYAILLTGTITLAGCGEKGFEAAKSKFEATESNIDYDNNSKTLYEDKIGEEKVGYYLISKANKQRGNTLIVEKPDGRKIYYYDHKNNDQIIENIFINMPAEKDGSIPSFEFYRSDISHKPVIEKAQKQFNDYLKKIDLLRSNPWLKKLKEREKEIEKGLKLLN